jgi:hypothetical protein
MGSDTCGVLRLTYPEHLCVAHGAHTLGRRPPILHLYRPGVRHLSLLAALHTISLHFCTSLYIAKHKLCLPEMSIGTTSRRDKTAVVQSSLFLGTESRRKVLLVLPEPLLILSPSVTVLTYQFPEPLRMVHLFQMGKFMDNHIVDHRLRRH